MFGYASSALYSGYAVPIISINVDNNLIFNSSSDFVQKSVDVSDYIIYRRAYVSYDGSSWTQFNLTPTNTVSGDWIYGRGITNISFSPSMLHLNTSRTSSNNTFIIVYSCSKNTTLKSWDCHSGWQILQFNAQLNSAASVSPSITFLTPPTPNSGSMINTSGSEIVASITDDSSAISSWIDFDKSVVGYWSMDSYSLTGVYDNSSYKNFGSFSGGLGTSNIVAGVRGNALSFDGVNDYLSMNTQNGLPMGNSYYTLAAWVYPINCSGSGLASGILRWGIGSNNNANAFVITGDCKLMNYWWNNDVSSTGTVNLNTWSHVAVTYDGSNRTFYINGVMSGSYASSGHNILAGEFKIGSTASDESFKGSLDEVMIFNRALSSSEIKALYDSKINKFDATFVSLSNGQYNYTAYAIDDSGNIASSGQKTFNVNATSTCIPACSNKQCGSDGCSGTCGTCLLTQTCNSNGACINNVVAPFCGDNQCNGNETCSSCPADCGQCPTNYLRTFYVSSSTGSANGDGSINNPWKTLAQVNAQTFKPGDAILFKRGDIWYGTLTVKSSGSASAPITYGAYGSGEKPIITGFTEVTGWNNDGNRIYSKIISTESMLNIASVDGANTPMGRWPDTGWLTVDSHNGKTSITSGNLSNSPSNWGGGELVLRTYWWVTDRNKITSHSGNTLYYTSASSYNAMDGNGYFIQNHKGTLNKPGDWAYDGSKLYIYFDANDYPNNHIIKIPTVDDFAYLDHKDYITFDNLHITGYNNIAIVLYGSTHITVTNCVLDFIGNTALTNPDWTASSYADIENNLIDNINNDAIYFSDTSKYVSIQYNTITNIGTISGLSGSGDGSGVGIGSDGDNSLIKYNYMQNIGYNGITFSGTNSKISNNIIDTFCMNKDDGGGIYTYENSGLGKEITNNIVINGVGAAEGTRLSNEMRAHGIYIDGSDNILISRNTIAHNYGNGMFINTQALNMNIQYNTVFDNADSGIQIVSNMGGGGSIRGMNMQNNIFFAKDSSQEVLHFATTLGDDDVTQIGTVDNNYYTRPINEVGAFKTQINAWGGPTTLRNLAGWQSYSGLDANSKKSPISVSSVNDILFYYNERDSNKNIALPSGNYVDVANNAYSGSITLSPWTSIVLIKKI